MKKILFLLGGIALVVGGVYFTRPASVSLPSSIMPASAPSASNADKEKKYVRAPEFVNPSGFINTNGIALKDVVGSKVILVDFWTYSCINCQRTLPYLTAWYDKYKDQGLEIISVHTPEFAFEKKNENVARAAKEFGINYPIIQDNDYATWNAYGNRYWPRKYLIDIDGYIVYDHIGEGAYEETERKIQEALAERKARLKEEGEIARSTVDVAEEKTHARSPEIYFGAARNTNFGNGKKQTRGEQTLTTPEKITTDTLYLDGTWDFGEEFAQNRTAQAKITFRYNAKNVFMVARADTPISLRILRDGMPIMATVSGVDVAGGAATVRDDRLYHLVADPAGAGEHTLEIIVDSPGLQTFTFTFG